MSDPFKMPEVEIGLDVWWYPSESHDPHAAKVVRFGDRRVDLALFAPGTAGSRPKDGVPHKDDPTRKKEDSRGFWVYSPWTQKVKSMLAELMSAVNVIKG